MTITPSTTPCPVSWCPGAVHHEWDRGERYHVAETLSIAGDVIDPTGLPETVTTNPAWPGHLPGVTVTAEACEDEVGVCPTVVVISNGRDVGTQLVSWEQVRQVIDAMRAAAELAFGADPQQPDEQLDAAYERGRQQGLDDAAEAVEPFPQQRATSTRRWPRWSTGPDTRRTSTGWCPQRSGCARPTTDWPGDHHDQVHRDHRRGHLPDLRRQVEEMWPSVYALRNDKSAFWREFIRFEMLKGVLNAADVEPCPVPWCDHADTHAWDYAVHDGRDDESGASDRIERDVRKHSRVITDVTVEAMEFSAYRHRIGGVDPGGDQPLISVEEVDSRGPQEAEAHIAALQEAARVAFGGVPIALAERAVLDAVRELANGSAGQNAVIEAWERLTVARTDVEQRCGATVASPAAHCDGRSPACWPNWTRPTPGCSTGETGRCGRPGCWTRLWREL